MAVPLCGWCRAQQAAHDLSQGKTESDRAGTAVPAKAAHAQCAAGLVEMYQARSALSSPGRYRRDAIQKILIPARRTGLTLHAPCSAEGVVARRLDDGAT